MGDGRLDAYEVLAFISKTKFSEVYKARRKEDGTLVALKKIEVRRRRGARNARCARPWGCGVALYG